MENPANIWRDCSAQIATGRSTEWVADDLYHAFVPRNLTFRTTALELGLDAAA